MSDKLEMPLEDFARAVSKENARLRAALRNIKSLTGEINTYNYDHNDVVALNEAFIEAVSIAIETLNESEPSD